MCLWAWCTKSTLATLSTHSQISMNNSNLATMFYTIFSKYNFIFSVVIQIAVVNNLFL